MSAVDPQNPLGIRDLDHLEFCTTSFKSDTAKLMHTLGLEMVQVSQDETSKLFTQGQIRFVLTHSKHNTDPAQQYLLRHGEGVCGLSFWVDHLERALDHVGKCGVKILSDLQITEGEFGPIKTASFQGLGDIVYELVERPSDVFRYHFKNAGKDPSFKPLPSRCSRVDHMTNNVPKGQMDFWANFYAKVFGMKEIRYFDIKGSKTGLHSRAMGLANRKVIIPINEPDKDNSRSQIQEFLDLHKGPGVQHIAFLTNDIISCVADLQSRGVRFLDIPHTYYEDIPKREIQVKENLQILEERQILVDGKDENYLLQNFTDTYIGPLFFEFIQRKGHMGFGEGNFTALFESIERDQLKRGYIK